jgi:hypothetical protein
MDDIDRAQRSEELAIQSALTMRRPEPEAGTGQCLFCEEPIEVGHFCDSDCREDHARLVAKQENDRVMRGLR